MGDNEPCYAISGSWWFTFKWILDETKRALEMPTNPGPLNNLDILEMDEETKKSIMDSLLSDNPPNETLDNLELWDKMKIRKNLTYNQDFIIVSNKVWNFLHNLFGGGPKIELFPETYNISTMKGKQVYTEEDEGMLDLNLCVNLELKKLNIIKDKDASTRYPFFVSLGANAKAFFQSVCQKLRISYNQSQFSYYDDDINCKTINLDSSSETLSELGIKDNTVISVSKASVSDRSIIFPYDDELSQQRPYEDRRNELTYADLADGVINMNFNNRQDENFSTKTDSTGLPNQNSTEFDEAFIGTGENVNPRPDFLGIQIPADDTNQINIKELQEKIKMAITEEKIQLTYKPLKEIRHNLTKLQSQWLQPLKPKSTKKQP